MKVVFDTNIYVSAFLVPGGRAESAIQRALLGEVTLMISNDILREVLDVLSRKFDRTPEELARVAVFLDDLADTVAPRRRLHVLDDDPDNRILECAIAAHADAIVTGDRAMLRLETYRGIRIISIAAFLDE